MFGNLQEWLILLIMLVPGFIVTSIQRGFRPRRFSNTFDWLVTSVLYGIFLNGFSLALLLIFAPSNNTATVGDVYPQVKALKIIWVVYYFLALYLLAVVWGGLTGKWKTMGLRALANRLGITPYAEHSSVWARIFDRQVPHNRSAIWVKISVAGAKSVFGRLRHSSAFVEQDKPIEVYISPYYELSTEGWRRSSLAISREESDGIYLKITDETSVEFFFRDKEWEVEKVDKA